MNELFITATGMEGSGKSSLKEAATILWCTHKDMGDVLRSLAQENGLTLEQLHQRMAHDISWDEKLDEEVRVLPSRYPRLLLVSRTAWFLHPNSIKVFVTVDEEVGAGRVARRQGITPEEALSMNRERIAIDAKRYRKSPGIPTYPAPLEVFDIVIDTTNTPLGYLVKTLVEQVRVFPRNGR